ncbi:competence type IV pilus minor pilin ComGF [Neobacillus niacini]|uniref:competence type IV pilus minor pilin ComGF n=1 Tax=Neobacillus niacini TaxID=86668 RepID=UPI002041381A|nr:competence type IV pilus minor pilin ComGF [Neobacillus niacini]MCM3692442.1 prepilin-type N-terminal cleavage/methylation domain-containing protein [Neobacillus niacini]
MKIHSSQVLKTVRYPNEKAFTLLEVLFAFSIFTMIVFFMFPVIQIILDNKDSNGRLQNMEWDVFCSQIKREIRISSKAEVISGTLVLTLNNEKISYEKYGSIIRRRVNSTGHETILQNVSLVTFTRINNSVKIFVKDVWEKEYSVVVQSYIEWVPLL